MQTEKREIKRVHDGYRKRRGIRFDDNGLTPEERKIELTRQAIWMKFRVSLREAALRGGFEKCPTSL
jgi:hypothetical protein